MNEPTCDDVADLIDLYAAGECDPAQQTAVRAHVEACDDCRHALDESRRMMGLLDVHFRQEDALARLGARLKQEACRNQQAPRLRIVHRFAAVAALLLVTFGLGVLLAPVTTSARPAPLQLTLLTAEAKPEPPIARGHQKAMAEAFRGDREFAQAMDLAKKTGDWPLPPAVAWDLVVTNPGRTPIELDVGGPEFRCEVELRGGPVTRQPVEKPAYVPFPRKRLTIAAGKSETLRFTRLASQSGERVTYLYAKGEYEARVRLEVVSWRGGRRETVRLTAGPRSVRLP